VGAHMRLVNAGCIAPAGQAWPGGAIDRRRLSERTSDSETLASADEAGDGDNQFGRHYGLGYVHLKTRTENP
jgi:hypothetical protein